VNPSALPSTGEACCELRLAVGSRRFSGTKIGGCPASRVTMCAARSKKLPGCAGWRRVRPHRHFSAPGRRLGIPVPGFRLMGLLSGCPAVCLWPISRCTVVSRASCLRPPRPCRHLSQHGADPVDAASGTLAPASREGSSGLVDGVVAPRRPPDPVPVSEV